jgi:Flp pilus assembly protein TadG
MGNHMRNERGTALIEAAITIPILLLIGVGLFEFGRAFQHAQILTNAAREGARMAVLPNTTTAAVEERVRDYMGDGSIPNPDSDTIVVGINKDAAMTVNGASVSASEVTIDYPFDFMVLAPVAKLVNPKSTTPGSKTMRVSALMRNEAQ